MDQSADLDGQRGLAWPSRAGSADDTKRAFWRQHAWWPLLAFVLFFGALEGLSLDRVVAREWFFDPDSGLWPGMGPGEWWARGLLHTGGRWIARVTGAAALCACALSLAIERFRGWRRPAGFVLLAMVLPTLIVGGLKAVTNVDCPWDLAGFGGHNPYVALFADRPDALPHARCFPGAHSSSGFALMCFYFVLRDGSRQLARWALAGGFAVGVVFSIGQEARGAHFLSHDLTSAAIVWFVQLAMYRYYARASASTSGR